MAPVGTLQVTSKDDHVSLPSTPVFSGLSEFFPRNTSYFYSFPSGEDSGFFNGVPAWVEELVAARSLVCAGPHVNSVVFAPSLDSLTWDMMTQRFGVELVDRSHVIGLSDEITDDLPASVRNMLVKTSLCSSLGDSKLAMAQPFLDASLKDRYLIPPRLTINLNDKVNRRFFIPSAYMPFVLKEYVNGEEFFSSSDVFPFPVVIKVASSSSGDGVRIAMNDADLLQAKQQFKSVNGRIIIEEHVESAHNVGIQFGIPSDPARPIRILGYNEQLTSRDGGFLAGIINPYKHIAAMQRVYDVLLHRVLPRVRSLGWYGVGGIDVLITRDGRFYFIDANFRMTATSAFIYLQQTKHIVNPVASFVGSYCGSYDGFLSDIVPLGQKGNSRQIMSVIGLTYRNGIFRFNAGVLFDTPESLKANAKILLDLGVHSDCLKALATTA